MENENSQSTLSNSDKIQILMTEYNNLNNQLGHRYDAQFQAIFILAAVLIGLLTVFGVSFRSLILAIFSALIFVGVWLWIEYDITRQADWLRSLEANINARAGEQLLGWELRKGPGGVIGKRLWKTSN